MIQALFASRPRRLGVAVVVFVLSLGAILAWAWHFFPDQPWDTETLIMRLFLLPAVWLANGLEEPEAAVVRGTEEVRPWQIIHLPGMKRILLACFLAGLTLGLSFVFEGLYMVDKGGESWLVGLMFGLAACSELPSMQATDSLGRNGRMELMLGATGGLFRLQLDGDPYDVDASQGMTIGFQLPLPFGGSLLAVARRTG